MPRYYFDIREGDDFAPDEEGLEFSSIQAVQEEAARSLWPRTPFGRSMVGSIRWRSKSETTTGLCCK